MKALLFLAAVAAQLPAQEFLVASVHLAKDDGSHDYDVDKGLLRIHNLTLKRLIAAAYGVKDGQVLAGPNGLGSETFDITAKLPAEYVDRKPDKVPEMLQALLAERFHLVVSREPRQVSGFELVVAKKGLKMEAAQPGLEDSHTNGGPNRISGTNVTMEQLATRLSRVTDIGSIVVDKTGLAGRYNFDLNWVPAGGDARGMADAPSIFTVIQEQLGLKLESARVPIEAVVVERAERPEEN
jgi:uncharacterized protein (TIGR03435 family)